MEYDVFLSYKCSDETGEKTLDYQMASEVSNKLISFGYNVFFSSETLEQEGSSNYKNAIDEALDTVKLMIVVASKVEYANSKWVQYEWNSYYNDFLSGVREEANLFTLTTNVNVTELPRTLRNVQNFDYSTGLDHLLEFVKNKIPKVPNKPNLADDFEAKNKNISIITGKQITHKDIYEAVLLDTIVYDDIYHVDTSQCEEWFKVNPDIYVMAKDTETDKIIAYVNISPVTDECYERLKNGDFIDTGITADMVLSYDMPFPYSVYFSSIVIHPDYQNTSVFMEMFNAIIKKFIWLGEHDVYIRRMIADAVTKRGEKFCNLFGMKKIKNSNHDSTLYEVSLIPPKFRITSPPTKQLWDYYQMKYNETPYLFDEQ